MFYNYMQCMRREMLQVMRDGECVGLQNHTKATNSDVRKTGTMQSLYVLCERNGMFTRYERLCSLRRQGEANLIADGL